jgi:hypothetical protein
MNIWEWRALMFVKATTAAWISNISEIVSEQLMFEYEVTPSHIQYHFFWARLF